MTRAVAVARCSGRVPSPPGRSRLCRAVLAEGEVHDGLCPSCASRQKAAVQSSVPGALVAYCDGSGSTPERPCGAGVVIFDDGVAIIEVSVHLGCGTNNHAELSAVRVALGVCGVAAFRGRHVVVRSDSTYTLDSLMAAHEPHPKALNAGLIATIRRRMKTRGNISFEHVRGHSGEPGNERADVLAGEARLDESRGRWLRSQMTTSEER